MQELEKKFHIIIPARYGSTRFPGKPLADIAGKAMIIRVLEKAKMVKGIASITVATDDERIAALVSRHGQKAIMTSPAHVSGTDRIAEAAQILEIPLTKNHIIINLQGDEPFIKAHQIESLCHAFEFSTTEIATLCKETNQHDELTNPNLVKVVRRKDGNALYFSRSIIPYQRLSGMQIKYYKHIGIYAYRANVLQEISKITPSTLEIAEQLEQLRWLENGYSIKTVETDYQSPAVDTPEDLKKILERIGELDN